MQGHFDAADWCGGGGRQLRAAGVTGLGSLPQHATGWVLVDTPVGAGFGGGRTGGGRACGELLPPPCDVDIAPTVLEHFGVAPRREWALDGAHLLAARRTDTALSHASSEMSAASGSHQHTTTFIAGDDTIAPLRSSVAPTSYNAAHATSLAAAAASQNESSILSASSGDKKAEAGNVIGGEDDGGGEGDGLQHSWSSTTSIRGSQSYGSVLSAPGPFASHLPGLFEPTGCAVVGHRGFGMNRCSGRGIRENTVASFIAAHGSGAGWCEFDVQVTADGIPVIWHDNILLVRHGLEPIQSFSIRELDLAELKALSRAAIATAAAAAAGVPAAVAAAAGGDATEATGETKLRYRTAGGESGSSGGGSGDERGGGGDDDDDETPDDIPVVFYRKFPVGYGASNAPHPEPWIMDVEDEIPTLEELMKHAPRQLGFSMELKYDEANPCSTPRLVAVFPKPGALSPKPYTLNPELRTLHPEP